VVGASLRLSPGRSRRHNCICGGDHGPTTEPVYGLRRCFLPPARKGPRRLPLPCITGGGNRRRRRPRCARAGWIVPHQHLVSGRVRASARAAWLPLENRIGTASTHETLRAPAETASRVVAPRSGEASSSSRPAATERHPGAARRTGDPSASSAGRILPRDLWESVGGMQREKGTARTPPAMPPPAKPDMAEQYGVVPPKAASCCSGRQAPASISPW
jgi:hypothetical protein